MAQPSVSSFFITRKRGIEDDVISSKKKVICLERTRNSSESNDAFTDTEELGTQVVFQKALENVSSNDEEPKKVVRMQTVRQGITPQRTTRSKKVHMQEVDGIETPKIVNFWKGGNLSPQKKARAAVVVETPITPTIREVNTNDALKEHGMSTPVKQNPAKGPDTIEKTDLISGNGMRAEEIKKKLKGSSRLAELKTSLNKLNSGLERLDQMENRRLASGPIKEKRERSIETPKTLKPFKSIELEILR
jgi:chromatin licensing and DNA replication factor 1